MPSLPTEFLNSLSDIAQLDLNAFAAIHTSDNQLTSIRLNPFKPTTLDFEIGQAVPWCENAYYLPSRPSFTYDPFFHAGCYYVQEAGSMFLEHALKQSLDFNTSLSVLDLCGAPGGKSTSLNSLLNNQSLLVSNDPIASRSSILSYNLSKWGTANTIVTNSDPSRFSKAGCVFDVIVVDAPCSGSGLFRKQPEAIQEWSLANVQHCSERQRDILTNILPCLKEDGVLFYSTCSYSTLENEDVVKWLLSACDMEWIPLSVDKNWGIVETEFGYRFYPHLVNSEGFFCAVLRKKSGDKQPRFSKLKNTNQVSSSEQKILECFTNVEYLQLLKKNNQFHLLNDLAKNFLLQFEKNLYFKKAGVNIGEIKGSDFIPNHELAISLNTNGKIQNRDLSLEEAISFLKKVPFHFDDALKGLTKFTYKSQGIGWGKILEKRLNNYLPPDIRILK